MYLSVVMQIVLLIFIHILDYIPTVFENKTASIDVGTGPKVNVSLWDTAGTCFQPYWN